MDAPTRRCCKVVFHIGMGETSNMLSYMLAFWMSLGDYLPKGVTGCHRFTDKCPNVRERCKVIKIGKAIKTDHLVDF